jgi:putative ABC transport system permease protein
MEVVFHDFRYALRAFRQNPGFTITAIVALALGIGASTSIFSVLNAVLLRPLPFTEPERLVVFDTRNGGGLVSSPAKYNFWREQTSLVQDISAFRFGALNLTGGSNPEQIGSAHVSADFFRLFGVSILRGRGFLRQEDVPGGGHVTVISHRLWERRFGGDSGVIGKSISLNGESYQVVGILGPSRDGQSFLDGWEQERVPDVWIPFQIDPHSGEDNAYLTVAGRLKPGVTLEAVRAQLQVATEQFRRRFPGHLDVGPKSIFTVIPMQDVLTGDAREQLQILAGAVWCC